MHKKFQNNPRPLLFCLAVMFFLCMLLLALYLLAEKENVLLKTARSEQFLTLAAGEAEAAAEAWRREEPVAEVYHRLSAAAEYLSMAAPTEENRTLIAQLRDTGAVLLQSGTLPVSMQLSMDTLAGHINGLTAPVPEESEAGAESEKESTPLPWDNLAAITRREGDTIAETMTETKNTLTPASGKYFIYTCRNVYVKLSPKGGIPLEMAVYTPVKYEPSYSVEKCTFRSSRFLENLLPLYLREKTPVSTIQEENRFRFVYPCGNMQVRVDVRRDTGRVIGLQMLPGQTEEQPVPAGIGCSCT